jgi:hypothetical protein
LSGKTPGFLGEKDEHGLGNLFRSVGLAGFSQRGGIHEIDMAGHEGRKGGFGIPFGVLPQQIHVGRIIHSFNNVRRRGKRAGHFQPAFLAASTSGL